MGTIFKIYFDKTNVVPLTPNTEYEFSHKYTNDKFKMLFDGYSRIDREPIFKMDDNTNYSGFVNDYTLFGMDITSVSVITPLEDQTKYYNDAATADRRVNEILNLLSIDRRDLVNDDSYKSIIRDIKIMKMNS